ncbi:helix-turn-helix domain-containing protein [Chloroflexota bacterium]
MPFCHFVLRAPKPVSKDYPLELNTLGDHLRKVRLDRNLLQRDVAQTLGVDPLTVTNWEKNHSAPQLHFIPAIIAFLGYLPVDNSTESFGEGIVRARQRQGLTQCELARRLGVDPSTLGRWERGIGLPLPANQEQLEGFLESGRS